MTSELPRTPDRSVDATRPVPVGGRGEPDGPDGPDGPGGSGGPGDPGATQRIPVDPRATQQVPVVVPRRLGDYELLERVGEGGMGVVWRARDVRHPGREVAIKVLRPHIAHDAGARERLRREVHTLARVHHPRVAAVIDADVDGPAPYIVTDFVPGPPLDEVVDRDGPLRGEVLLRVARGLAGALHAIHEVGIVHRDLKPGNVLLVGEGQDIEPVVIDFGIAQVADDVRLTSTGLVMGTPGYLSPEVAEGGGVSPATDWWGWAATLAYAASGQPPFGRGPVTVVLDRVARGRVQLDGVDPRLRPLLAAALDPDPGRRPTEAQVLDGLERYARHEDVTGALPQQPGMSDQTRMHDVVDPTRVAPQHTVARTRMAPQPDPVRTRDRTQEPQTRQFDARSYGTSASPHPDQDWRQPAAMPESWAHGDPRYAPPRPGRHDPGQDGPDRHGFGQHGPGQDARGRSPGGWPVPDRGGAHPADAHRPHAGQQPGAPDGWQQPGAPGGWQQPGAPGGGLDPRIGRRARTGTLTALLVLFVGLAAVVPVAAWGLYALWGLTARTVDRTLTGLVLRRHEAGRRASDVPMTVLAAPLHLVAAALSTVLGLLLPLAMAVVTALVFSGLVTTTELLAGVGPAHPLSMALGALIGGTLGWWGLGSTSLRRGSRTLVRGAVPRGLPTTLLVLVCLLGAAALGVAAAQGGDIVSWWPLPAGTDPLDLLHFGLP